MKIATATKKVFLHNTRLIKTIYMPMMIHVGKKELKKWSLQIKMEFDPAHQNNQNKTKQIERTVILFQGGSCWKQKQPQQWNVTRKQKPIQRIKTQSKNSIYSCNRFSGSIGALSNSNDCWIDCIEIYDTKADGMNQQTTQKPTERNSIEQKIACKHF